jgi:DNA-binding response OmpR family regulator
MKLLLLEDDHILSETLQLFLSREGYHIDIALDIYEAETLSFQHQYDLYLFDINLPEGSGLELLRSLRHAEDDTPTIFITAQTDMHSMAQGFDLGAIDYIKKPFAPEELLIRIGAKFKSHILTYKDISFDQKTDILRKDGEVIDLGNVNHQIFTKLLLQCGLIVTKEELYTCFEHSSSTALRVAISTIKQKLGIEIKNIRAKGYMLENL